jgi:uncharacterized protein
LADFREVGPDKTAVRDASFGRRRPLTVFLALVLGIGLPVMTIPVLAGLPIEPFLLVLVYGVLLGSALRVTRLVDGPGAVRHLLSRLLVWRFGVGRWAVILLGMPVLTLTLAAASGTLRSPESGWAALAGLYLFDTLALAALINLWEETAWGGFAQSRLTARHGLLVGALLTAIPFAVIHIPLQFAGDWTWSEAWIGLAVLFAGAPFYRYLLGMHLLDTGGSVLAIAVQHASWNAVSDLEAVQGWWQPVAAAVLLTLLVAAGRRVWSPRSRAFGVEAEKAAAAGWAAPPQPLSR